MTTRGPNASWRGYCSGEFSPAGTEPEGSTLFLAIFRRPAAASSSTSITLGVSASTEWHQYLFTWCECIYQVASVYLFGVSVSTNHYQSLHQHPRRRQQLQLLVKDIATTTTSSQQAHSTSAQHGSHSLASSRGCSGRTPSQLSTVEIGRTGGSVQEHQPF